MTYRLTSGFREYEITTATRSGPGFAPSPAELPDLWSLMHNPANLSVMRQVVTDLDSAWCALGGSGMQVAEEFRRLLARGFVSLRPAASAGPAGPGTRAEPGEPWDDGTELAELAPKHFVEFRVVAANGAAVGDLPYVFHDGAGGTSEGTLAKDGRIRRDNVPDAPHGLELCFVERIEWGASTALSDDEVQLYGRVSGYPDGTPATISIYREFDEAGDPVDTVDAEVCSGGVAAAWRYPYDEDDTRAAEQGEVRFVAELAVGEAPSWAKTAEPLTIGLRTLAAVRWAQPRVAPSAPIELIGDAHGFSVGATAEVNIHRITARGGAEPLDTLTVPITDDAVRVQWTAPASPMELFFELVLEDGVARSAVSGVLAVG